MDAYRIFVEGVKEVDETLDLRLTAARVAEVMTEWTVRQISDMYTRSQIMLKQLTSSAELASVRQSLWNETHNGERKIGTGT